MISSKRFDIYEHKNSDGTYNAMIRDNVKLKNNEFDYTQSIYGATKKVLDKFKKEQGVNSSNSQKLPF